MLPAQTIQSLEQAAQYLFVPTNQAECDQLIRLLDNLSTRFKIPAAVFV